MRAPYGLNILDNCLTCSVREEHLFCNLSIHAGQRLNEIKSTAVYPKGAMLFIEGQQPRGVFVLCAGKKPGQANFIPRESLLQFLKEHGEVALRVAEQL
jgi:CRP/FNR family transcriptional regulator, cyclic AMP receptor protein